MESSITAMKWALVVSVVLSSVPSLAATDAGVAFVAADDAGLFVQTARERLGPFVTVGRDLWVHSSGAPVFAGEGREGW